MTTFGEDTANEMCFHFLMYYPKQPNFVTCFLGEGVGEFVLP